MIPLLRSAMPDVKPISLETPDVAYKAVELLFQSKAKEALATDPPGWITAGSSMDTQPLAGATVRTTLQLTVLMAPVVSAYRGPVERFTAAAGPDGQFELSSLCKGEYSIKAEAPGGRGPSENS